MPRQAQENALLDLALFGAYLICGGLGLGTRLALSVDIHLHIFLVLMHILSGLSVLALQSLHLMRHLKWIKTSLRIHLVMA